MAISESAKSLSTITPNMGVIEFCSSKYGFNLVPLPAQRFFLRLLNKEPLDTKIKDIEIRDKFNDVVLGSYTERDFYEFLLDNESITMEYDDYMNSHQIQTILNWGRRASKTTTISILIGYKLYQLLKLYCPQQDFGILLTDSMSITMTALGQDNADKLFSKMYRLISSSPILKPHLLENANGNSLKIWTKSDLDLMQYGGQRKSAHSNSINLCAHANSPGVRGENNLWCILDEFAHFNSSSKSTREHPLDEMIYDALTPSVSGFKLNGVPFGHTYIFSSPNGKKGKFYNEYEIAKDGGVNSHTLACSCSTWWLNPTVSTQYLVSMHDKNPEGYLREYGASFEKAEGAWLRDMKKFWRSFDVKLPSQKDCCESGKTYFLGGDFALQNDGTAFVVSHWEDKYIHAEDAFPDESFRYDESLKGLLDSYGGYLTMPKIVIDYIDVRYAGEGIYIDDTTLQIDKILDWLEEIYSKFPITYGIFDQWSSEIIKQLCKARGITKFEVVNHGVGFNDVLAKTFSLALHSDLLVLPYEKFIIRELQSLVSLSRGNGLIKVESPGGSGHDDLFSALSRSVFLTYFNKYKSSKIAAMMPGLYQSGSKVFANARGSFGGSRGGVSRGGGLRSKPMGVVGMRSLRRR